MSADRQRLQKELEEKKKKLAEYRKVKQQATVAPTGDQPAQQGLNLEKIDTLDDLLTNLGKVIPAKAPVEAKPDVANEDSKPTIVKKKLPTLSLAMNVLEFDILPKETETYTKGTQTIESSVSTDEHPELSHVASIQHKIEEEDKTVEETHVQTETKKEEPEVINPQEIMKKEDFIHFLDKSARIMERAIVTAKKFDVTLDFAEDDSRFGRSMDRTSWGAQTKLKLHDSALKGRAITKLTLSPKHPDLLAASYSEPKEETVITDSDNPSGLVYIWNLQSGIPEYKFYCESPVLNVVFNPFSPKMVLGSTYSGQIVLWDLRSARKTPIQHSTLNNLAHTHPVYSMAVIGTANAHNLVTVSTDGKLCSWVLENLSQPSEVLELVNSAPQSTAQSAIGSGPGQASGLSVSAMTFPSPAEVNQLYIGTEEGVIYSALRHGNRNGVVAKHDAHHGPITSINFHNHAGSMDFSSLLLTSSTDWTCKLWNKKNLTEPLYSFEDFADYVYDIQWSPVHPAVFATVDGSGALGLWNLNEETEVPVVKTNVTDCALTNLQWLPDGKQLVVGGSNGEIYVMDIGDTAIPRSEDSQLFTETLSKLAHSSSASFSKLEVE